MYDPQFHLLRAPGPLWIDVFVRQNFTADSNAAMVLLFREMSRVEEFVGNITGALIYEKLAHSITEAMNTHLWREDHYITDFNPDVKLPDGSLSSRDFVDYDSNLLAVAFGVAPPSRARSILRRIDSGKCTHARATWVSEKYYDEQTCYQANTGDSAVTMARIGWADAHARRRSGDLRTFEDKLLEPLVNDILATTFMYERYDCQGRGVHNPFYIEYPELISMLLREVRYGIQIGLATIIIDPFGRSSFSYHIGNVHVEYRTDYVRVNVPVSGVKTFEIHGLKIGLYRIETVYTRSGSTSAFKGWVDESGILVFQALTSPSLYITVNHL
eukprot:TRINITY_DN12661_c0_g1_i10.p1 TRINITY_DN12661_c0_g1~~TRINITY_DN12661_c0_g1_i10.p1  ORF type:complete len:329 (-),score=53.37 TRINITY_DN12661_c0_g1_i10:119-1105(-)